MGGFYQQDGSSCKKCYYGDLAESEYCSYVVVVLLDLLPEAHGLVVLRRVDVLGPPALHVVHPLRQELGALRVHLHYVQKDI